MEHNQKQFHITVFLFIALFVFSRPVYTLKPNLKFNHITTKDGLSQSNVRCIYKDRKDNIRIGTSNSGFNDEGTSLKINIIPSFWKTCWAYVLYFLFAVSIVFGIIWYIITRERLKHELKIEHMELEKLYELDQIKTKFYSNISHEFRTPLTLILGSLERMISFDTLDNNMRNRLQLMGRNAKQLLRMTNQLLDFHKIEGKNLKLELIKLNIIQFIHHIVLSFQDYAEQKEIHFHFTSQADSLNVWFDPDKVEKILHNLLSNAFKFTAKGGKISVKIAYPAFLSVEEIPEDKMPDLIAIAVHDNGTGIPPDQLGHIFDRFYQVDNSYSRPHEGTGIGLALTHELIELYQGQIHVESEEDKGSCFTVYLPLNKDYLSGYELMDEEIIKVTEPLLDVVSENRNRLSPGNRDGPLNEYNPGKEDTKILLIEDNADGRSYIKDVFANEYHFTEAKNGLDGLEKAVEIIPDLIISDIMMPGMDGIQLCNQLKDNQMTSHIPVILITALSEDEHRITGLETGADAYISKPFNETVLQAQVKNLLVSRKKLRTRYRQEVLLEPADKPTQNPDEKFLRQAANFVEDNLSDITLNAEMLGHEIGMSRTQLYCKLKSLTGQTVHEFIRDIRLKRSVHLLKDRNMTVTEVAFETGFKELSYFTLCFKKKYHQSPSNFKKL